MPVYQIDGLTPVVPDESYVHPYRPQRHSSRLRDPP